MWRVSTLPVLVPFFFSHSYCVILRQASSKPGSQSTTLLVLSQCSQEFSEKHKKQRNFGFGFVVAFGIGAGFRIGVGVSVGVAVKFELGLNAAVAVGVAVKFELRLSAAAVVGGAVKFELRLSAAAVVGGAVKFELRLSAVVRVGTDFAVGVRVGFDEGSEKKMKVELLSNTTARVKNRSLIHLATRRRQQRKLTRYYSSPNLSNIGESNFS